MTRLIPFLAMLCLIAACHMPAGSGDALRKQAIDQITQAEKDFAQMAAEKGVSEAFAFFADSSAVIKRQRDTLIRGKADIRLYYSDHDSARVTWAPDFVDASSSGDLGYTYGKYTWQIKDSSGEHEFKGVFHTVWKRQADGSWKYVWD